MYTLTLVYPDGTHFVVGGFPDLTSLNAWVEGEKAKPSWKEGTTMEIENPPPANPVS